MDWKKWGKWIREGEISREKNGASSKLVVLERCGLSAPLAEHKKGGLQLGIKHTYTQCV